MRKPMWMIVAFLSVLTTFTDASGADTVDPWRLLDPAYLPRLRQSRCVQYTRRHQRPVEIEWHGKKVETYEVTIDGPGIITRMWCTEAGGVKPDRPLQMYFDGEAEPKIDTNWRDLVEGRYPPFVKPLVGGSKDSSGGHYSYFPIPFCESVRIVGMLKDWTHITVQHYDSDTPVKTFSRTLDAAEQAALDRVARQWMHLGTDPKETPEDVRTETRKLAIPAGGTETLFAATGPAQIARLEMRMGPADDRTFRQVLLSAYWDQEKTPSIDCPIGDFFGCGFGPMDFRSLMQGYTDGRFYSYWPMPFANAARLEVVNEGGEQIEVEATITYVQMEELSTDTAYFHARWRRDPDQRAKGWGWGKADTSGDYNHLIGLAKGRGHFVGCSMAMMGVAHHGFGGFMEGDEMFFVDGEEFPSTYGTGTEDYFNGGFYFRLGPFAQALHGCVHKSHVHWGGGNRYLCYRYQVPDAIPFTMSLRATMEHGSENNWDTDFSSTMYWYQLEPHGTNPKMADALGRLIRDAVRPSPKSWFAILEPDQSDTIRVSAGTHAVKPWWQVSPDFTGGDLLVFEPEHNGDEIQFTLTDVEPNLYDLILWFAAGPECGTYQLRIDERIVADKLDFYGPEIEPKSITLAGVSLAGGSHTFKLTAVGKNQASQGTKAMLDSVTFDYANPFIGTWWIAGPVGLTAEPLKPQPHDDAVRAWVPETGRAMPDITGTDGKPVEWQQFENVFEGQGRLNEKEQTVNRLVNAGVSDADNGAFSTSRAIGKAVDRNATVYLVTCVWSPEDRDIVIHNPHNSSVRPIWINGEYCRKWRAFNRQAIYPVMHNVYGHLKKGWNVLATRTDGGLYYLRINDPRGELRYALEVEGREQ